MRAFLLTCLLVLSGFITLPAYAKDQSNCVWDEKHQVMLCYCETDKNGRQSCVASTIDHP
jgi:hypothetical protein